ncbi:MAG: DUF1573 domain-containing protein [Pirellulaceae bacterium]|nr:DUF1573 domain-containing protein [Pirellulaceae bacterium]
MMVRRMLVVLGLIGLTVLTSDGLSGQEWVRSMFQDTSHDFGIVPRGADAVFEFKFTNKYEEDVHVAAVRSSCGCTIPRIKKADVKTYEESAIVCEYNTKSFIGPKAAVVTVVFSKPYYGEMQLNIKGNIRSDIDTDPGMIDFGEVDRGTSRTTQVKISYAGRNLWEIMDVRSANQNLGVAIERTSQPGKISYIMNVRLKDTAPAGEFLDNIILVTNEPKYNLVTIPVRGAILPPLVLPMRVDLGTIKAGEQGKSFIVARSKTPFEVRSIECKDERFVFKLPEGKKDKHVIPFEFNSGDQVGAVRQTIKLQTDLSEDGEGTTVILVNVAEKG